MDRFARKVLVAEDTVTVRTIIAAQLRSGGFGVDGVGDGRAALEAAARGGYGLVLMDLLMPKLCGLAAARAIRALSGPEAGVPILALTATADPDQHARCLAAGMNGVLIKPVPLQLLLDTAGAWCRRPALGAIGHGC